ncbi:MAG: STAS/SEC14 domain-containing protein [Halopseudomonas sp.]
MLMKLEQSSSNRLGFLASGKLTDNDYKNFLIPEIQQALEQHPSIRLLFLLEGFRGWELQAAWDDLVFGLQINSKVERLAVIGDQDWERWMAQLANPFSHGEVQYFNLNQTQQAWHWLSQEAAAGSTV